MAVQVHSIRPVGRKPGDGSLSIGDHRKKSQPFKGSRSFPWSEGRLNINAFQEAAAAAVVKLSRNGCTGTNGTFLTELLWER